MTPKAHFDSVWERCNHLSAMYAFLNINVTPIMRTDEILRSEWVARVSALDMYIHELVSQGMLHIFNKSRPMSKGYASFKLKNETVDRIRSATTQIESEASFDLAVREQLKLLSFQHPDKIADGIRLISDIELWNEIAIKYGALENNKNKKAASIKKGLSILIDRRNKIAHEGDLELAPPWNPFPISVGDLAYVKQEIENLVVAIDQLV